MNADSNEKYDFPLQMRGVALVMYILAGLSIYYYPNRGFTTARIKVLIIYIIIFKLYGVFPSQFKHTEVIVLKKLGKIKIDF